MKNKLTILMVLNCLFAALPLRAEIKLPAIIGDHMVLQQKQADPIWGWGTPGAKVTVTFAGQTKTAEADANGKWLVKLDPLPANDQPQTITISDGLQTIEVKDVLIGEVWMCSGQSNMGFAVRDDWNADVELAAANFPKLRLLFVPHVGTQKLQDNFKSQWNPATPKTAATFSAVGFFYGRYLHQILGVPVGLIDNSWGGSAAEAWVRRSSLESDPRFAALMERTVKNEVYKQSEKSEADYAAEIKKYEAAVAVVKTNGLPPPRKPQSPKEWLTGNARPGNIFNGVVNPTRGYGIKGVIWYQGESNASRAREYGDLFPFLIEQWRKEWNQGEFPFYWVQLANYMKQESQPGESSWAELREAQTKTLSVTNTGQAVIIDLGEGKDIHPKNKHDVVARLVRWALVRDYGFNFSYRSPEFENLQVRDGKAIVKFECFGSRLRTFNVDEAVGFAVCGSDQVWHWATGKLLGGDCVALTCKEVTNPVAVRYAWANNPACNLTSLEGLPVTPFQTSYNEISTVATDHISDADLKLPITPGPFSGAMNSLTNYSCPDWFRDAKFGIWAHWGPQAVPEEGDWYARKMYVSDEVDRKTGEHKGPSSDYKDHLARFGHPSTNGWKDIIPLWKAEKWEPEKLMELYKKAGAKYFVSMGTHHDNFFLWNSKLHRWNSVLMGPHRDVVGEWQAAAKKNGLPFGVSEHLGASFTWFQDAHKADKTGPFAGVPYDGANSNYWDLYHFPAEPGDTGWYSKNPRWHQQWYDEIKELVDNYHPDLLYSDGGVAFGPTNVVGLTQIANLYNDSLAQNGGKQMAVYNCKQDSGGRWVQDYERGVGGGIDPYPWQTDTSIGDWFYDKHYKDKQTGKLYCSPEWVARTLVDIVSKNGNLLLNVVLRPDGSLDADAEAILHRLAKWTAVNGEAIYGSRPWHIYGEGVVKPKGGAFNEKFDFSAKDIRFTTKGKLLYAIALGWPTDNKIVIRSLARTEDASQNKIQRIELLGNAGELKFLQNNEGLIVDLPTNTKSDMTCALRITGSELKPASHSTR